MKLPAPCKCPNCGEPARCIDFVEAEVHGARIEFDHEYECDDCGVFAPTNRLINLGTSRVDREYVWRDGTPPKPEDLALRRQALVNVADGMMFVALEGLHAD